MTLPIARELARSGIRVVTIAPGIFETPMMAAMTSEVQEALGKSVPFPARLVRPDEFAKLTGHVIENSYLNGEVIRLDATIRMPAKCNTNHGETPYECSFDQSSALTCDALQAAARDHERKHTQLRLRGSAIADGLISMVCSAVIVVVQLDVEHLSRCQSLQDLHLDRRRILVLMQSMWSLTSRLRTLFPVWERS